MISFVLPIYKKPLEQLKRCIESLLDMSYTDIEVVASFDGPDATLEAEVEAFAKKDKRVKKVVGDHGGACKARNTGFKESTGEIVCFWDADCYAMPEMAKTWLEYFRDKPYPDFLYSGYKWTDPQIPGYASEPLNPWLLKKYNYICSMSPIRRDKVLEWDENLEGLQDWDYFRRMVDSGAKGLYVPCGTNAVSAGFETEFPDQDSISGVSAREKAVERINKVREKHGDAKADILVYGDIMKQEAVNVAQILDADYFNGPFWITHEYKACLIFGFNPMEMETALFFANASGKESKKIIYWMGLDADMLANGPFMQTKALIEGINGKISANYCPDVKTKNTLEDLGIKTDILTLPVAKGELLTDIPKDFKVLAFSDKEYEPIVDSIIRAMPDVDFDKFQDKKAFPFSDYTVVLYFLKDGRFVTAARNALILGRHMISNVQEPYSGYIDPADPVAFKENVIAKIREIQANPTFNKEAQDYYKDVMSPERFRDAILSRISPVLEVVNA